MRLKPNLQVQNTGLLEDLLKDKMPVWTKTAKSLINNDHLCSFHYVQCPHTVQNPFGVTKIN